MAYKAIKLKTIVNKFSISCIIAYILQQKKLFSSFFFNANLRAGKKTVNCNKIGIFGYYLANFATLKILFAKFCKKIAKLLKITEFGDNMLCG